MRRSVPLVALVVAALLLLAAAPAGAARDQSPLRFWSVSKILQGDGKTEAAGAAQLGGVLDKTVDLGQAAFNVRPIQVLNRAVGKVFSSADGVHYSVLAQAPAGSTFGHGAVKGGATHLDEYQAYEKRDRDASLKITVSKLVLDAIDGNPRLAFNRCPGGLLCQPLQSVVLFHARAYADSAGGDFFRAGGMAYLEGRRHHWRVDAATTADSEARLWALRDFAFTPDFDGFTESHAHAGLLHPRTIKVPLTSLRRHELFAVHVTLDAVAIDDRGGEAAAQSFIDDPQHRERALLTTRGLARRSAKKVEEPPVRALAPAHCRAGRHPRAGRLQLSSSEFVTGEASGTPLLLVTRSVGSHGAISATVHTAGGSARSGHDFRRTRTRVRFGAGDASPRFVEVPLREDASPEPPEHFTVSLAHPRCGRLGARHRARVTIVDDDQPPFPPAPRFTIGGTVDGLQGSGLVLSNFGAALPVSGNGRFTFPGTAAAGQSFEVSVRTQPHDPDQVCAVQHGAGTVTGENVTDVTVHCQTLAPPTGLDPTFGSGGRVSTPVGGFGHGEAVVLQPAGGIVTAGWRSTPTGADFALTRHDSAGRLDTSFGAGGIATTDLGGADDEAYDAALLPGGGVVAAGRTDAAGFTNLDFGVVRYRADGTRDPAFGDQGIVETDITESPDQANAVAVQPDGKIVVAGFTAGDAGIDADVAVARYDADGTLDTSFGGDGIVTTDLGTTEDEARALVIRPDGKIVVAGTAGEDVALIRYLSDGQLDSDFGNEGTTITDLGSEDVANGVALTPAGEIVVAGFTLGPGVNRDFMLLRYSADGGLDPGFGDDGAVITDVGGGDDFAENVAVDAHGAIVLVGRATSATILDMALVRYHPDGTLDAGFDSDGKLTADFHGRGEFGQDLAFDAAGRIVAAGYTANGADTEFALMRANP